MDKVGPQPIPPSRRTTPPPAVGGAKFSRTPPPGPLSATVASLARDLRAAALTTRKPKPLPGRTTSGQIEH